MSRTLKQLLVVQICFCGISAIAPYFVPGLAESSYSLALALVPVALCWAFFLGLPFARMALMVFSLTTALISLLAVVVLGLIGPEVLRTPAGAVLSGELVIALLLYLALKGRTTTQD